MFQNSIAEHITVITSVTSSHPLCSYYTHCGSILQFAFEDDRCARQKPPIPCHYHNNHMDWPNMYNNNVVPLMYVMPLLPVAKWVIIECIMLRVWLPLPVVQYVHV